MLKRLMKTCLAALLCSAALSNVASAQELGPIGESRIDLSEFAQVENLPVNPLPGGSVELNVGVLNANGGSVFSGDSGSHTRPADQGGSISKPQTSIDGSPSVDALVGADAVFHYSEVYYSEVYDGEVYEGVVEGEIYEVHSVLGLSAIGYRRNYGDARLLSNKFTSRGDTLTTSDAEHGKIG